MRRPRVLWRVAGISATLLLSVVGAVWAFRDTTPPELWLEAPSYLAAGAPLPVHVSSSKPVTFHLSYAGQSIERVDQELIATLSAEAGSWTLRVEAVDGAGLRASAELLVEAKVPPAPSLDAPTVVEVGDPLTVWVSLGPQPPEGAQAALITDMTLEMDGRVLPLRQGPQGWIALTAVALEAQAGPRQLRLQVVDEFGGFHQLERAVEVLPNPRPVELLQLSPSVLAVSTPAGRELEAETLDRAFAQVAAQPRWTQSFMQPIEGRGTSGFAYPRQYGVGGNVSYHLGADIAAPAGTPIQATNDGVVLVAGFYPIKGGLVIIDHGQGLTSLYFHQSVIQVEEGQTVSRGDVVGLVGSTGLSTGPHLHWEMRLDGVPTDPMSWVGRLYPRVQRP